ncbi:DUF1361 domain-containing protein [Gordonia sp. PP30]|uniref:DUF1361 domain-containing protein n=1 Tax=Gordonia sp. PP30 TaxID=2935861 RepID=UPI001FFE7748|nr:DUF1361 domain-containing protein [Gordonia sp. PP30]UQE76924.1 DUF1361 domain-containing protein [Gordonia sp. PP30]
MTDPRFFVLLAALAGTSALTAVLGVTDPAAPLSYPSRFLIWNLFLAWIPLAFALAFAVVRRRIWLLPLGLLWLAFLPNAPYLITDLVHLREGYDLWRHVLQYGVAAWTGIMLGVVVTGTLDWVRDPLSSVESTGVAAAIAAFLALAYLTVWSYEALAAPPRTGGSY